MSPFSQNAPVPFYLLQSKRQKYIFKNVSTVESITDAPLIPRYLPSLCTPPCVTTVAIACWPMRICLIQGPFSLISCTVTIPMFAVLHMPHMLLPQGILTQFLPSGIFFTWYLHDWLLTTSKALPKSTSSLSHSITHLLLISISHLSLCVSPSCLIFLSKHLTPTNNQLLDCVFHPVYEDWGFVYCILDLSHVFVTVPGTS